MRTIYKCFYLLITEETLITVTADHSHVFTIGGYPKRGNPVFGLIKKVDNQHALDLDGKPYTTLGYANGRGGLNGTRPNITNVDTADKKYRQQATVLLRSETHGSEDVGKPLSQVFNRRFRKKKKRQTRTYTCRNLVFRNVFTFLRECIIIIGGKSFLPPLKLAIVSLYLQNLSLRLTNET